jgi:hypothetical protein
MVIMFGEVVVIAWYGLVLVSVCLVAGYLLLRPRR